MPVIRKNEAFPKRPVIIVLYGSPFSGKTTLACTANNPIMIDCDRGADRAAKQAEITIIANNWDEVLQDEHLIKEADTVVIDTAKAVLDDFLTLYVINKNYSLKKNKLKMYGEIGEEFKAFVNRCREANKDIIIIAHAKEEKDGDITKIFPDVTGQSKDLILRIADQVGYVTMVNNARTILFEPSDNRIGKNVARLENIIVPDYTLPEYDNLMAGIIQRVKDAIQAHSKDQQEAIDIARQFQERINAVTNAAGMNTIVEEVNNLDKKLQKPIKTYIMNKANEINLTLNSKTKKFEDAK